MAENPKIEIGEGTLEFSMDGGDRAVFYKGKPYKIMLPLLKACPELINDEDNLFPFACVLNYILFGNQFTVIQYPDEYVEKYWDRKIKEDENPSPDAEIAQYWQVTFDVQKVMPPLVEDNIFFCCLEEIRTGVPYFLAIPYPIEKLGFEFELQPIPLLQEL